ncbi:MAG: IMPACT family protein [Bacteroidia bacterium]
MEDRYFTIQGASEGLYKEKGSKFIGYAFPVSSEREIKDHISELKKVHHSARHWCYAYRLGADKKLFRANDDSEPSGTAGKPILNQLISADLTNVLIVVVRYFGGTLLGTGGLITAYKSAAAEALSQAEIVTKFITEDHLVIFETGKTNEVMRRLKEADAEIINHSFNTQNEIIFSVRSSLAEKLLHHFKQNNILCKKYAP